MVDPFVGPAVNIVNQPLGFSYDSQILLPMIHAERLAVILPD